MYIHITLLHSTDSRSITLSPQLEDGNVVYRQSTESLSVRLPLETAANDGLWHTVELSTRGRETEVREGAREGGREGGGWEGGWVGGREGGGREGGGRKEGGREGGRVGEWEGGREGGVEGGREGGKCE